MIPFAKNALLLAPMVGITNRAFRTLLDELGAPDYAFTEMASAEAFTSHAQYEAFYTDARPSSGATSVQFYARSATAMAVACKEILSRAALEAPAGIDINFGCSAPHIRKSGGGSAWSSNPAGAAELVAAARSAWPGALSAKIRMGPDDDYDRFLSFCSGIADAGLDFLSVHPRTDRQKFKRQPRHEITLRLARDLSIPVVANGDIADSGKVLALLGEKGAYAVMIGREAVRRPWIFRDLRAELSDARALPSASPMPNAGGAADRLAADRLAVDRLAVDRLAIGRRFLELAAALLPEVWQLETCRRFFSYYAETMSFAHHIKYRLMNSPSLERMGGVLTEYFEQVPGDRMVH
ncbi:MAG TPA: tRNA-dihydrouridine synthase family protein [Rectinemataceae bacterium]|nr:tRNA-dihydrouridine synthase family protein [Rectinemataceae bacterium]